MNFDASKPYKNIDGVNINLTTDELAQITAQQEEYNSSANILIALASHRYKTQVSGTVVNGIPFLTDPNSQLALMGANILAISNPSYTVNWKTPNGFIALNAAQISAIYAAGAAFIQKCFDTEAALITNVSQYATAAAIIAAFNTAMGN